MGKIIIDRENNYISSLVSFNIYINNQKTNKIKNGELKEISVVEGNYEIFVKNTFDKSNTLKLKVGKYTTTYIDCKIGILNPKLKIREQIDFANKIHEYETLNKLNELKKDNIITEEEYNKEKSKIL